MGVTLVLDGLQNFRDVGGLPLVDGGSVRPGVLYRSEALANLTPSGREAFAASSIGVVIDLRTPRERESAPNNPPAGIRTAELPIRAGSMLDALVDLGEALEEPTPAQVLAALDGLPNPGDLYVLMLESSAVLFAEAARRIAFLESAERPAALVHCTAGKDRTGVTTALVLDAVGVSREAIVAEYAETEANLAGPWAEGMLAAITAHGLPITEKLRVLVTGSPREAIEQALAWVDSEFGGAAGYLASGGLAEGELAVLRQRLVG